MEELTVLERLSGHLKRLNGFLSLLQPLDRYRTPLPTSFRRNRLRTLIHCETHSKPPSQNPSENPSQNLLGVLLGSMVYDPIEVHPNVSFALDCDSGRHSILQERSENLSGKVAQRVLLECFCRRAPPCAVKTCAVHPVFARVVGEGAAGSRSKQIFQGNNLRFQDEGGSRGRSSTQDQTTRIVSTCRINPGGLSPILGTWLGVLQE